MRLRELLIENLDRTGENKSAVLGWGRGMGHKGHMLLAKAVIHHAQENNAKPYFVVSRTSLVDPSTGEPWADKPTFTKTKDDPLSPEEKLATYRKVFPQNADVFSVATADASTLDKVLAKIARDGFSKVTLIVGELEKDSFSFLTRPDKSGVPPYQRAGLQDLEIISRQDTSEPSSVKGSPDYQEGPRATPMRAVLTDPTKSEEEQFAVWRDAMPDNLSDEEVKELMLKAKQRMSAVPDAKNKKKDKMAAENSRNPDLMSPNDYDRYQQNQMDYEKRDFKRREMEHELGHEDEWQRQQDSKPVMVGMYFYNVPADKEQEAASYGVKQTKSGKWAKTKYDKSGRTWSFQKDLADKAFGNGRYWEPKKESRVGEEAAGVGIVTKQNTTADVGPGTLNKMLKAFKLS